MLGENCRYDGGNCRVEGLDGLTEFFEVVPFCPEVEGGLPIPRFPAELRRGYAKLHSGEDVTRAYDLGASKALNICSYLGIKLAIMKQNSPACSVQGLPCTVMLSTPVSAQIHSSSSCQCWETL